MEDFKKWAVKYKELCVLTGIFGLLLSPFLWPFFLAIVLNSLTIAVPVLLMVIIIKQPWRENTNNEKQEYCNESRNEKKHCEQSVSGMDATTNHAEKEDLSLSERREKGAQPLRRESKTTTERNKKQCNIDEDTNVALSWYRLEGRERILRLVRKLEKEQMHSFSVSQEGICSVKEESYFRRVGVLRDFPKNRIETIRQELQKEGFQTNYTKSRFLWIMWKK